jgi:hypothetical protein
LLTNPNPAQSCGIISYRDPKRVSRGTGGKTNRHRFHPWFQESEI